MIKGRFALAATSVAVIAACSAADDGAPVDQSGSVRIAIAQVPDDVQCLRITVDGTRTEVREVDVAPGESSTLLLSRLPTGTVSVLGEAFAPACTAVGSGDSPTWLSEPTTAELAAGAPTDVALALRRNGVGNFTVDFVDDQCADVFYQDADGDGRGNAAASIIACSAPPGYVADDTDCDDTDPSLTDDCGAGCPSGLTDCGSACVDLNGDEQNCGACGLVCNAGELCSSGSCTLSCPAGLTLCSGACVDTSTDEQNCGACGLTCGSGQLCEAGACQTVGAPVLLRNDGFFAGQQAGFQAGFVAGECAASIFVPTSPVSVQRLRFLFGGATSTEIVTVRIHDAAGSGPPGAILFEGDYPITGDNTSMQAIDVAANNVVVSGRFAVALCFNHSGLPSVAQDTDGTITADRNWLNASGIGWVQSSLLGLTGDWIIRAEVSP